MGEGYLRRRSSSAGVCRGSGGQPCPLANWNWVGRFLISQKDCWLLFAIAQLFPMWHGRISSLLAQAGTGGWSRRRFANVAPVWLRPFFFDVELGRVGEESYPCMEKWWWGQHRGKATSPCFPSAEITNANVGACLQQLCLTQPSVHHAVSVAGEWGGTSLQGD